MKSNNRWHRRLPDFEIYDRIELIVVPRYKTSGLSGDEWRQSVEVKFWFKGTIIRSTRFSNMKYAIMLLAREWLGDEAIPEEVLAMEDQKCDQPSCTKDAVSEYDLKEVFSAQGEKLHPEEYSHTYYRQFCQQHLRRGDCGREDSDRNYVVKSGPGPDDSSNVIESPSGFAGTIELDLSKK